MSSGCAVRTPERAREVTDEVAASGADVGVVVAFGQLLPESLFTAVPLGFVNVHFSLLPRWRGAAPVERAILAGDAETGRVHHGDREGPRHRRGVRARRRRRSTTRRPRASCASGSSRWAPTCSSTRSRTRDDHTRAAGGRAHLRRQADGRGVRARLHPPARRARARRAGRQPAPGRVDHRRRAPPQGVARARRRRRFVRARSKCSPRVRPRHVERRVDARPARRAASGSARDLVTAGCALDALVRIEDGAYAQVLLPSMLARLQLPRSRSCVRHRPRLRHGARATPPRRPGRRVRRSGRSTGSTLRCAPRCASARTSCCTTSRATPRCRRPSTRSRRARRGRAGSPTRCCARSRGSGPPWPEPPTDAVALSYPDWIVERLARDLGDGDARAALVAMNEPAAMTLRPNPREATADALEAELRARRA